MSIKALHNQVEALRRKIPAHPGSLTLSEWSALCTTIMQALLPYPDAGEAAGAAFARLERGRRLTWQAIRDTIYTALKPFMEARVAVAAALMEVAHEDRAREESEE